MRNKNSNHNVPENLMVIYIYDLKAKDKRKFNRLKRLFYYHLNNLPLRKEAWKTKSTIAVQPSMEKMMDAFFRRFGRSVLVFKVDALSIEEL